MTRYISADLRGGPVRALTLAMAFAGLAAGPLLAAPHGGGGPGLGGMSGVYGNFGGLSASHMTSAGMMHTNGLGASDRDFGRDRASDRTSTSGSARSMLSSNRLGAADRDHGRDRAADRAHRHRHRG